MFSRFCTCNEGKDMIGRGVIFTAIAVYLAVVLGCVLNGPSELAAQKPGQFTATGDGGDFAPAANQRTIQYNTRPVQLPLRGIGMQIHRVDWIPEYKRSVDRIAKTGADTVLIVVDGRMENASGTRVFLDMRLTPSADQLGELIDHAKSLKLRVVLMPIVLLDNPRSATEWRGTINPEGFDGWSEWWKSYRSFIGYYAMVAEAHKVDVLTIGSELVSTEPKVDEWRKTIEMVRQTFKGMLTYSANWDHYKDIPFWDRLDLVSMNSYWTLGESREGKVGLEEIEQRWAKIKSSVVGFVDKVHKPLLFMEVGWCSLQNAAKEPWDYTQDSVPMDLELQKKLYEGFFNTWYGTPQLGGFMMWEWTPWPSERGYSPEGKPAEKVLREWMAKEPWKVK
jgi:hypothetical protein